MAGGQGQSQKPHFAIDAITGWLEVHSALDYESTSMYTLVVMATDQSANRRNATLTVLVRVIDVNEFAPTVPAQQYITMPENEPTGRVIYTAVAHDRDAGIFGRVFYSFLLGNSTISSTDDIFSINSSSGGIQLVHSLDYEAEHVYEVVIRCTDSGGLFSDLRLNVTVTVRRIKFSFRLS